jgi:uncharacterized protein (TIGR02147 family)
MLQLPNTRSYINDVLKGKRVSATFIERFIRVLNLSRDEARYFRALVHYNQSATPHERELYFDRLIAMNKSPRKILDEHSMEYYRHWYNSCIRALLEFFDFTDNYEALSRKMLLQVSDGQVRETIELLKKLGMIKPDKKGFLRPTDTAIASPDFMRDEIIRNYQLQCLTTSIALLSKAGNDPHLISTNTFGISEKGYKRIQKIVEQFRSQIRSAIHKDTDPVEKVYLMNIAISPLSK